MIAEGKKAKEPPRDSERRYRQLVENLPGGIWVIDKDAYTTFVNPCMAEMLGYTADEMLGKHLFSFMDERGAEIWKRNLERRRQGIEERDFEFLRKDGTRVYTRLETRPLTDDDGNYIGAMASVMDITEHKRVEEALREGKENLRALAENAFDGILIATGKGDTVYANKRATEITGYSASELLNTSIKDLAHTDEFKKIMGRYRKRLEGKPAPRHYETVAIRKDGESMPIELVATRTVWQGKPADLVFFRDITERKRMEEQLRHYSEHLEELIEEKTKELREAEERFRGIAERSFDTIFTMDLLGQITFMSPAAERVTGHRPEEFIGKSFQDYLPASEIPRAVQAFTEALKGRNVEGLQVEILRKDGSLAFGEFNGSPIIKEGEVVGVQVIGRDITERKRMEEALREAERLVAIGRTAGMVGHDLRNPLQAIVGALYLARRKLKSIPSPYGKAAAEKEGVETLLDTIEEQATYMNKLVSDLQDYARPLKSKLVPASLRQLIDGTFSTIRVPETVKVSIMIPEDFPELMVDKDLMRRVFTNLVINALQAMPDGGRLTIRASKKGEEALISVQDTGVGIPEESLPKLFQPLFTTNSRGVGFGLPVSQRLVEAHGGNIEVESEAGRGSTFTVKIPLGRG